MRFLVAAAVIALGFAPAASAEFGPPLASVPSTLHTVQIVHVQVVAAKDAESRAPSSCIVHSRRSIGAAGKVERKLAPVACEQPPRSQVIGAGFGFFFRVSP